MVSEAEIIEFLVSFPICVDETKRKFNKRSASVYIVARVYLAVVKVFVREGQDLRVPDVLILVREILFLLVHEENGETYMRYWVSNMWTFL